MTDLTRRECLPIKQTFVSKLITNPKNSKQYTLKIDDGTLVGDNIIIATDDKLHLDMPFVKAQSDPENECALQGTEHWALRRKNEYTGNWSGISETGTYNACSGQVNVICELPISFERTGDL